MLDDVDDSEGWRMLTKAMRTRLCLAALLLSLTGCAPERLDEKECKAIVDIEQKYKEETFAEVQINPEWMRKSAARAFAMCMAGDLYTRGDYRCFVSATSQPDVAHCMAGAHEKLPPPPRR